MKMKYTLAALAATTMMSNGAIIFDTLTGTDQAGFGAGGTAATGAGQTFQTGTLGTDNLLTTIEVGNRNTAAVGTNLFLAVYENTALNGTTWTPGTLVGVSTNQQDMNVNGGTATWNFNSLALSDNSRYLFTFTSDSAGLITVAASTRVDLNSGGAEQSAFTNGGIAFGGAHTIASQITTASVPEPSSTALLGLGGLALILRRRK